MGKWPRAPECKISPMRLARPSPVGDWRRTSILMQKFNAFNWGTVKVGLLTTIGDRYIQYWFDDAVSDSDSIKLLRAEIDLRGGMPGSAISSIQEVLDWQPDLRNSIAKDARFEALKSIYRFRVITGFWDLPGSSTKSSLAQPASSSGRK